MKLCSNCGTEIEDGLQICPSCGQETGLTAETENTAEAGTEETAVPAAEQTPEIDAEEAPETGIEETAEEAADVSADGEEQTPGGENAPEEDAFDPENWKLCGREEECGECEDAESCVYLAKFREHEAAAAAAKKKARRGLIAGIAAVLAVIAVVAIFLVKTLNKTVLHVNDKGYESYSVSESDVTSRMMKKTVATCGDEKLTNADLQAYYQTQYMDMMNNYGSILSYMMDTSLGLDEQEYTGGVTWQRLFLDQAIEMFQSYSALCQEAEKNGFVLSEDSRNTLDTFEQSYDQYAESYGYEDGNALIRDAYGPGVNMENLKNFYEHYLVAWEYFNSLMEKEEVTDEDIRNYYEENLSRYESYGDDCLLNVRHILVKPQEEDESGAYTDEAWTAAEEEANRILDLWLSGDATEESFAELAGEYTQDPGSVATGGLYEEVYPGQMVPEFNDWCYDDGRQVGDYGIVKTTYGYHIMYMSGIGDHYGLYLARNDYYNTALTQEITDRVTSGYEMTQKIENAAIVEADK